VHFLANIEPPPKYLIYHDKFQNSHKKSGHINAPTCNSQLEFTILNQPTTKIVSVIGEAGASTCLLDNVDVFLKLLILPKKYYPFKLFLMKFVNGIFFFNLI